MTMRKRKGSDRRERGTSCLADSALAESAVADAAVADVSPQRPPIHLDNFPSFLIKRNDGLLTRPLLTYLLVTKDS
jgi:hypothetical protein